MAAHTINAISICSGVGGLDRGFRAACPSLRTILYVEREVSAASVLAARMQDGLLDAAPVWSDLGTLTGPECSDYIREATGGRGIDAIFGGPPCQGFSVAGKQLGADDPRDQFPNTLRAIEHYRPWLVFLENVPGSCGYVSERVIPVLHRWGYRVPRPVLLEAAAVGASQKRERLFLLAVSNDAERRPDWSTNGRRARGSGQRPGVCEPIMELASRPQRGRGSVRQPSGGDGQLDGSDDELGDSKHSESRHGDSGKQSKRRRRGRGLANTGEPLAKPARHGGDRLDGQGGSGRGVCGGDDEVDAAGSERLQSISENGPTLRPTGRASRALFGPFPPGPGLGLDRVAEKVLASLESGESGADDRFLAELAEYAKWQRILEVRPDLAPAISEDEAAAFKSGVRNVAHEFSRGVDLTRADQLRALGNGVVADQACAAFRILWERLEASI